MGTICVNRSGRTLPVTSSNGGSEVIGQINPNQVFTWVGGWAGNHTGVDFQQIYFHVDGVFKYGWLAGFSDIGGLTPITNCSLYSIDMEPDGRMECVFTLRRPTAIYNASGSYVTTLASGSMIATRDGSSGQTNKYWMSICAYGYSGPTFVNAFIDLWNASGMDFGQIPIQGTLR